MLASGGRPRRPADLRYRRGRASGASLDCFVLDCSGSMVPNGRLALAKGVVAAWFAEAARARRQVALVSYGGDRAQLVFAPAVPRWWNARWIQPIGGGGGTPLAAGLQLAERLLQRQRRLQPGLTTRLWLLTDGRCRSAPPPVADQLGIIDFGTAGRLPSGARRLAAAWQADYLDLPALDLMSGA